MSNLQNNKEDGSTSGIIGNIYNSMSKIIEAINKDNLIINQQVKRIKEELEIVCKTVSELKDANVEIITTHTAELSSIMEQIEYMSNNEGGNTIKIEMEKIKLSVKQLNDEMESLKNKNNNGLELHRQILDIRTNLLHIMDSNTKNIKKEISEIKDVKNNIRNYINNIAFEDYQNNVAELKKEFEELKKEHRFYISNLIRKSKSVNDDI